MKNTTITFLTIIGLLGFGRPIQAAKPPSDHTEEETLWRQVSQAAQQDLGSPSTQKLMEKFLLNYPQHPKTANIRYMQAEEMFQAGDYKSAAVRYEKFLNEFPQNELADSAAFRLGESYYNVGAYNSAKGAWDNMVKRFPQSALVPDAMEWLTQLHMRAGEWGMADEQRNHLTGRYAHFARIPRVREKFGIVSYYLKEYNEGTRVLQGIDEDMGAYYRGLSFFALKLYDDAADALKTVTVDRAGTYAESASFLKAESFFQKKNFNVSSTQFQTFIDRYPSSPLCSYAYLRLAACYLLTREPAKALSAANQALAEGAKDEVKVHAWFLKGCALTEQENLADAADYFQKVSERSDFPALAASALVRKGWVHIKLKQPKSFDQCLKALEEKFPSSSQRPLAQFLSGARLFEEGKWEEAGQQFEQMLIRSPYSVLSEAALALMGIAYTKANKPDQLTTAAHSALKIFSGNYSSVSPYWRGQSHYFIGKAYFQMDKFKEAVPFFERVSVDFADHPLSPSAKLHLAVCLVETQKYDKARSVADELIENKKTEKSLAVQAAYVSAMSYFNAKDYNKALSHLDAFLKDNPKDSRAPEARYLMGVSYHQKKVFGSAIESWDRCIKDYPEHPLAQEAYLNIGDLYFKAGKFADAANYFKRFQTLWPGSKYAQVAMWQEMQSDFNGKDDEAGIKVYAAYLKKYPDADNFKDAQSQLEMIYYRRGEAGDPDKLVEFLEKFPKSPYAPSARFKLGQMAVDQKKWNRAASEFEQFVQDYPKDALALDALYRLGQAYENLKEPEKAMIQYRHILEQFSAKSTSVDAAFRLGSLYFAQEKFQEAVQVFRAALPKKMADDVRANLHYNMALCFENLGQLDNAASSYGEFAKVSKNKEQVRESLMAAAVLSKKSENHDAAVKYLAQVLKDPGSADVQLQAINVMAECYKAAGREDQAVAAYQKLLGMEPAASDLRLAGLAQLAYLYEQKKRFDDAVKIYEKIAVSEGKAEWVKAAQLRISSISQQTNAMP